MRGLEPPRLAALEPKSSASTSSATSALGVLLGGKPRSGKSGASGETGTSGERGAVAGGVSPTISITVGSRDVPVAPQLDERLSPGARGLWLLYVDAAERERARRGGSGPRSIFSAQCQRGGSLTHLALGRAMRRSAKFVLLRPAKPYRSNAAPHSTSSSMVSPYRSRASGKSISPPRIAAMTSALRLTTQRLHPDGGRSSNRRGPNGPRTTHGFSGLFTTLSDTALYEDCLFTGPIRHHAPVGAAPRCNRRYRSHVRRSAPGRPLRSKTSQRLEFGFSSCQWRPSRLPANQTSTTVGWLQYLRAARRAAVRGLLPAGRREDEVARGPPVGHQE